MREQSIASMGMYHRQMWIIIVVWEKRRKMSWNSCTLELSARAYHRILKTARTIADLEEQENIAKEHLLEAACYRPSGEYWG